jgi:hypothetical protein
VFVADVVYSVLTTVLNFIFTGLLTIPITLLQQAFGVA